MADDELRDLIRGLRDAMNDYLEGRYSNIESEVEE